jgi:hypothetical protein
MPKFVKVPRAWDIERGFLMLDKLAATQENIDNLSRDIKSLEIQLTQKKRRSCKGFDEFLRCQQGIRWILPNLQKCLDEMREESKDV